MVVASSLCVKSSEVVRMQNGCEYRQITLGALEVEYKAQLAS